MSKVYVIGHRNPDMDSIVSAMAYASLRNALGDREFVPMRLGEMNDETKYILDHFGFEPPTQLSTVRTQVEDLAMDTPPVISKAVTVSRAWGMLKEDISGLALPVVNDDGTLYGMLSPGDVATYDMISIADTHIEKIPLFNLLSSLEGQLMSDADGVDSITGEVTIALPQTQSVIDKISKKSLLICGDQPDMIRAAIEKNAAGIIICASEVASEFKAAQKTCVINTPYDAYRAMRLIFQSIQVGRICQTKDVISFHLTDYLDDVREIMLQSRYRSYPVLDENEKVVGTISRFHLIRPRRKRVVLVDHNEVSQSVPGLDQAEILEILDHHRLADVQTGAPIYFRNEPVGSTATIIAGIYQEKGVMPSSKMAGLLASAIVADTIMFKSPTSTDRDKRVAERMARIADISLNELGLSIFSGPASEHSVEEMLVSDFKEFHIAGHNLGIAQVICMDSDEVMQRAPEIFENMQAAKDKNGYDLIMLMLTDVLREGTRLLFLGDKDIIRQAFNVKVEGNDVFLPGVMSRKKQIVPMLSLLWG